LYYRLLHQVISVSMSRLFCSRNRLWAADVSYYYCNYYYCMIVNIGRCELVHWLDLDWYAVYEEESTIMMILFIMIEWTYGTAYVHLVMISYSWFMCWHAIPLNYFILFLMNDTPSHFTSYPIPSHGIIWYDLMPHLSFHLMLILFFIRLTISDIIVILISLHVGLESRSMECEKSELGQEKKKKKKKKRKYSIDWIIMVRPCLSLILLHFFISLSVPSSPVFIIFWE